MKRSKDFFRARWVPDKPASFLSKEEIAMFRNNPKQNICVKLLEEGYHRSFSELFQLLGMDKDRRAWLESRSFRVDTAPLEEQKDKLEAMKLHLSQAEEAERRSDLSVACEQRLVLGHFFSAPEDLWLRLHFYHSCADKEGGCRAAADARLCLAEVYLQQGNLEQTRQEAELYLKQTEEGGWLDSDGRPLRLQACRGLGRIYSWLADAPPADTDHSVALTLLNKAYSLAKESEHKPTEGEVAFRLGRTYQKTGDHKTARQFFKSSAEIYSSLDDANRVVKADVATAKSLESEGNVEEAILFLQKSAHICQKSGLQSRLAEIYQSLGRIHFNMRRNETAHQWFLQGYESACNAGNVVVLQKTQVMVASFAALDLLGKHLSDMQTDSTDARGLQHLLTGPADENSPTKPPSS
ncbi:tetratricopeptide repeat protein 29 [Xenentodon cancila]